MSEEARKIVTGLGWVSAASYLNRAFGFITTLILARLLAPDQFGAVAVGAMMVDALKIFRDMGLGQALIYRKEDSALANDTAMVMIVGLNVLLFAIASVTSPLVSKFFGDPSLTPSLENSASTAYGSLEIEGGSTIGLYWEVYRPVSVSAPLSVSIKATRVGASFLQRLGCSIGISKAVTPVSIKFTDNGRPDSGFGRSLSLNFPAVPDGEYQLSLVVAGGGQSDSTTQRIRVRKGR